jgi:hypothetical protein
MHIKIFRLHLDLCFVTEWKTEFDTHIILEPGQVSKYIVVLENRGTEDRFAEGMEDIFLPLSIQTCPGVNPVSYIMNISGLLLEE